MGRRCQSSLLELVARALLLLVGLRFGALGAGSDHANTSWSHKVRPSCGSGWTHSHSMCEGIADLVLDNAFWTAHSMRQAFESHGPLMEALQNGPRRLRERLCAVCSAWAEIERTISPSLSGTHAASKRVRRQTKISGGIYLYPEQVAFVLLHLDALAEAHGPTPLTICETGFNAGHSAALFLTASPHTRVQSFDRMDRPSQKLAERKLREIFGAERLRVYPGDSNRTVPAYTRHIGLLGAEDTHSLCDMAHPSVPGREQVDLLSLRAASAERALVMPTALDAQSILYGRGSVWARAVERGVVCNSTCHTAHAGAQLTLSNDLVFARAGAHVSHVFCAARYCPLSIARHAARRLEILIRQAAPPTFQRAVSISTQPAAAPRRSGSTSRPAGALRLARSSGSTRTREVAVRGSPLARRRTRCDGARVLAPGLVMSELLERTLSRRIAHSDVVVVGAWAASSAVVRVARENGQRVHVISGRDVFGVDRWFDERRVALPGWVLLMVLDAEGSEERALLSARRLLAHSTITYLVLGAQPGCDRGRPALDGLPRMPPSAPSAAERAVSMLRRRAYKVQALACTHDVLPPNTLLTRGGAQLDALVRVRGSALLFATQGLDLAVPARSAYVHVRNRRAAPQYAGCAVEAGAALRWASGPDAAGWPLQLTCRERTIGPTSPRVERVWFSAAHPLASEVACVWVRCARRTPAEGHVLSNEPLQPVCAQRVRRLGGQPWPAPGSGPAGARRGSSAAERPPNLLVVLLDPISRAHFRRSLPLTAAALAELGYAELRNLTVVGPNSGPNQAALYAGMPLRSREGVGEHAATPWLWDRLRARGYATLKSEDGCVANSNMVQSLRPNVSHGEEFGQLFCAAWARPNCAGSQLAAAALLGYATAFASAHERARRPFGTFLSLVDSHEDSMALAGVVDKPLARFLRRWQARTDTATLVLSDHGLHYGPYFLTAPGERERAEPILFAKLPRGRALAPGATSARLTHFDVHATLLELLGLADERPAAARALGRSLLGPRPVPAERPCAQMGIPPEWCGRAPPPPPGVAEGACPRPHVLPSLWSFYAQAEITGKRPALIHACHEDANVSRTALATRADGSRVQPRAGSAQTLSACECATAPRGWRGCPELGPLRPDEDFVIVACNVTSVPRHDGPPPQPSSSMDVHMRIARQQRLVRRSTAAREQRRGARTERAPPSLLILELDSVSRKYAQRHLPLAFAWVQSLRGDAAERAASAEAPSAAASGPSARPSARVRAFDFEKANVLGTASIANQMALLAGCMGTSPHATMAPGFETVKVAGWPDPVEQRCDRGNRARAGGGAAATAAAERAAPVWLHDVARSAGYVSMVIEEICPAGSPWVLSDTFFDAAAAFDHRFDRLFCTLATQPPTVPVPANLRRLSHRPEHVINGVSVRFYDTPPSCFPSTDGESVGRWPLRQLEQLWDAYAPDVPRFAFGNLMAAHSAAPARWQARRAEQLDGMLRAALERLVSQGDTIAVLRGDHGLQQKGVHDADWSVQMEHRSPWTTLLVPEQLLDGRQAAALRANEQRLITGLDLHRTLLGWLAPRTRAAPPVPWAFDLAKHVVPPNRTCADARIPPDLCGCEDAPLGNEGESAIAPKFGICNKIGHGRRDHCVFGDAVRNGEHWDRRRRRHRL